MGISPGFLLLLLFFMMMPVIKGGGLNGKSAKALASLIGAIFALIPFLAMYFICLIIFNFAFK
jgi:hypothetical protein